MSKCISGTTTEVASNLDSRSTVLVPQGPVTRLCRSLFESEEPVTMMWGILMVAPPIVKERLSKVTSSAATAGAIQDHSADRPVKADAAGAAATSPSPRINAELRFIYAAPACWPTDLVR